MAASQDNFPTYQGSSASFAAMVGNLNINFLKGYDAAVPTEMSAKQFYNVDDVGPHAGKTDRYEEPLTALMMAKAISEGDPMALGAIAPGYYKDITVVRRTAGFQYTWDWEHHNKYPNQLFNLYKEVGMGLRLRIEMDLTHNFTFGTATSYTDMDGNTIDTTTGDGLTLFYSAHTLSNSTTTYRTRLAGNPAASPSAIEAALSNFNQQIYDNNGNRIMTAMPDTIIIGSSVSVYNRVKKIVYSTSPRDEANSNVMNPLKGSLRIVQLKYLDSTAVQVLDTTKSEYFIICDSSHIGGFIRVTENPTVTLPTIQNGGIVFNTEDRMVKGTCTYERAIVDPRFMQMSSGDGTA